MVTGAGDMSAERAVGDALHQRMLDDDLWGMPIENVDRYADAAVAIAALCSLPVEQRMEAMGMRDVSNPRSRPMWVEDDKEGDSWP